MPEAVVIRATAAVLLTNTFLVMQLHTRDVFCILQFVFLFFCGFVSWIAGGAASVNTGIRVPANLGAGGSFKLSYRFVVWKQLLAPLVVARAHRGRTHHYY
jgi:hypothetical protein